VDERARALTPTTRTTNATAVPQTHNMSPTPGASRRDTAPGRPQRRVHDPADRLRRHHPGAGSTELLCGGRLLLAAVADATTTAGPQTGVVTSSPPTGPAARGIVRLLNTAGGRVLCLAGEVDGAAVASFLRRYGREPVRIDRIDAGSVISLSGPGLELLLDHLDAAERAGRPVAVDPAPQIERLLAGARACPEGR
jgi:hypothetical protein